MSAWTGVTLTDQNSIEPATTYYYRVRSLVGNAQSEPSNVASVTTADQPFFLETWDKATGPYYPDAYPADTTGTLEGTDQPDWQWSTLGSWTMGASFREAGDGYEFGRFDTTDSGPLFDSAPMTTVTLNPDQNLYAGFDVTMDSTAPDGSGRYAMQLRSETDYSAAPVSAVSLWLDGADEATRFGALVTDQGKPSTTVTAVVAPASGMGAKHYRVMSAIRASSSSTLIDYQVLDRDDNDRVLLSGNPRAAINGSPAAWNTISAAR